MLRHYLIVAYRALLRDRLLTLVTVLGLGAALALCLLVLVYLHHEWGFDRFHRHGDRVYVVYQHDTRYPTPWLQRNTFYDPPLLQAAREGVPGIERTSLVRPRSVSLIDPSGERTKLEGVSVGSTFLQLLTFPLSRGELTTALSAPGSIVLDAQTAARCFGAADPIGQTVVLDFGPSRRGGTSPPPRPFTVTGVLAPVPANSTLLPQVLLADVGNELPPPALGNRAMFVQLAPAAVPADVEHALTAAVQHPVATGGDPTPDPIPEVTVHLLPLNQLHWTTGIAAMIPGAGTGNRLVTWGLAGICVLILVVAGANFVTLSLARTAARLKEIGVRKAIGAQRHQVRVQFILESILLASLGAVTGLVAAEALLPGFTALVGLTASADSFAAEAIRWALLLAVVVGVVAGLYPAIVAARMSPTRIMRLGRAIGGGSRLTQVVLVVQFGISALLLVLALVVGRQVSYVHDKDLGLDTGGAVVLGGPLLEPDQVALLAGRLQANDAVAQVAGVTPLPGAGDVPVQWFHRGQQVLLAQFQGTAGFAEALGVRLVQGTPLPSGSAGTGGDAILVNQTMARLLGPEPLGSELQGLPGTHGPLRVVGIVEDFHQHDLRQPIRPCYLRLTGPDSRSPLVRLVPLVRFAPNRAREGTEAVERTWRTLFPELQWHSRNLGERVTYYYDNEERQAIALALATVSALVITCMGLLALTALTARQRTKEIGIRKVLGAGVPGLVFLLCREYAVVVCLGNVLAAPAAHWLAGRWLEGFAYRIDLGPGSFAVVGLVTLAVALSVVVGHSLRAALANPVDALRYE